MLSVEGTFHNGVIQLDRPVAVQDGQKVLILLLQEEEELPIADSAWDDFAQLIQECQVITGIRDLAHQHDRYLHGTPKRKS